jgi:hypothetical protein
MICPIRMAAVQHWGLALVEEANCLKDKCAWYVPPIICNGKVQFEGHCTFRRK